MTHIPTRNEYIIKEMLTVKQREAVNIFLPSIFLPYFHKKLVTSVILTASKRLALPTRN